MFIPLREESIRHVASFVVHCIPTAPSRECGGALCSLIALHDDSTLQEEDDY